MTDQTPSTRAGLRDEIADALEAADYSGTMRRGDLADPVMPVLYRAWPWLRAEAEELDQARETNRRLNLRAQQLESELAAYRRAVRRWEVSERGTYIPHASLRAIGKASGVDILGSVRHLRHFERVEQAEATIARVRDAVASFERRGVLRVGYVDFDIPTPGEVLDKVRAALEVPADPQPEPWLHVTFTSPDDTTANTSALAIRDHLRAEFDGVNMRITSNAVEPAAEQPARTTPDNPAASENTADNPAATEATDVGNKPDAPAWTPPPPGSDRDKLPDHLLPLIADRMRPYLSTACETAAALEAVAPEHPAHAGELRQWTEREHASCRLTRKQDMADCVCGCHGELKSCGPNSSLWPIS